MCHKNLVQKGEPPELKHEYCFFQCLLKSSEHKVCHRDVCNQLTVSQLFSQYTMLLILLKAHITSATAETYYV